MKSLPAHPAWVRSATALDELAGTLPGAVDRHGRHEVRLVMGAPPDRDLSRLGSHRVPVPGEVLERARRKWGPQACTWIEERPGAIVALAGLLEPRARGFAAVREADPVGCAPALVQVELGPGATLGAGPVHEWVGGGIRAPRAVFVLIGAAEVNRAASEAGFSWHSLLGVWTTTDPATASTMGAYAHGHVRTRMLTGGIPRSLIAYLRFGPMLLPWSGAWVLSAAKRYVAPENAWRHRGPRAGWRTTNVRAAERALAYAPKPLKGLLEAAAEANVLARVKPASLNLIDPKSEDFGLDAIAPPPPPPRHRMVWCKRCRALAAVRARDAPGAPKCGRCDKRTPLRDAQAHPLVPYASPRAVREWGAARLREETRAKRREVSNEEIRRAVPAGADATLHPYQVQCVRHALSLPVTLNATQVGGGKTICAFTAINALMQPGERALVVAPRSLVAGWLREAERWLSDAFECVAITRAGDLPPANAVAVASYERVVREAPAWTPHLDGLRLLVADEAHYLKRPETARARAVLALPAERWLFLTATPIYNRPPDLAPILAKASPRGYGHVAAVRRALRIVRPTDPTPDEEQMLEHLGELLSETIMVRPDPEVIAATRPAKARAEIVEVDVPGGVQAAARERALLAQMERSPGQSIALFAQLAALRRRVALEKVEEVVRHLEQCHRAGEAFLVFSHHRDVCEALAAGANARGVRTGIVNGAVPPAERTRRCDEFMAKRYDGLSLTLDTGGIGLNLQRASEVLIVELDWSPAALEQAEGRAWRLGQTREVKVRYFVVPGTIDAHIANLCASKDSATATAMGEDRQASEAMLGRLRSLDAGTPP